METKQSAGEAGLPASLSAWALWDDRTIDKAITTNFNQSYQVHHDKSIKFPLKCIYNYSK